MSVKTAAGSAELGEEIRERRNELGLTIEEAAAKAGVGSKTWSRYEAGGSIRNDKISGICKVLKWKALPDTEIDEDAFNIDVYKDHEAWSENLAKNYGLGAALSFAMGSDLLYDDIREDLDALAKMPKGTHIGELGISYMIELLPEQFLMNYDYDFLFLMRSRVEEFRRIAKNGGDLMAHTVLDEIVLYSIMQEAGYMIEEIVLPHLPSDKIDDYTAWDDWVFDIFGDADVVTVLYSDIFFYVTEDNRYHFKNWYKEQFYCDI